MKKVKMKKVLVIGDSCTDIFQYGRCERLCPEAPVPVFKPMMIRESLGMAMNVYNNLKALGVDCDIITNEYKPTKTRYIDEVSNQMLLRVDECDVIDEIDDSEFDTIEFDKYDAIIISDYNKGFLSNEDNIKFIAEHHPLVFMDTKKKISSWASSVDFIKINKKEFENNCEYLLINYEGELIVTLGKDGAKHWMNEYPLEQEQNIIDVCGAGDVFMSAFVADFIATYDGKIIQRSDIKRAIKFANKCAAWSASQKGIAVIDLNKIK